MVLDLTLFRKEKGGDPDMIRESQKKRYKDVTHVDRVVEIDNKWREVNFNVIIWGQKFAFYRVWSV